MTQFTTQSVLFSEEFHKPVTVTFDQPDSSSDGGAVLLKAVDNKLSLTEQLHACMNAFRQPGKGGFSTPAILDYLDREHVEYLVGFAGNSALAAHIEPLMRAVRVLSSVSGKTETLFMDILYQTKYT